MAASDRWYPPAAVLQAGEQARVTHSGWGSHVAAGEHTQKAIPESLRTFRDWVAVRHREVSSGGMRRSPAKPDTVGYRRDPHEEGIAIDFMTHEGDDLANWLVLHAGEIGIQYVLWNKYEWSASNIGPRWETYTGAEAHADHVHMELSPEGIRLTGAQMTALLDRIGVGAVAGQQSGGGSMVLPLVILGALGLAGWWIIAE